MIIAGIFFIICSAVILYKRLNLILFGKSANGVIVGYGNGTKGLRGVEAYNYRVKYDFRNKTYFANALESAVVSNNDIPKNYIYKKVTVYFKPDKPEVVTIKEFKGTAISGLACLGIGGLSVLMSFTI